MLHAMMKDIPIDKREVVFVARGLSKVYGKGDVVVQDRKSVV